MEKLYSEGYVQDIADAIRSVNGSSETYKISEMADAIRGLSGGFIKNWKELIQPGWLPNETFPRSDPEDPDYDPNLRDIPTFFRGSLATFVNALSIDQTYFSNMPASHNKIFIAARAVDQDWPESKIYFQLFSSESEIRAYPTAEVSIPTDGSMWCTGEYLSQIYDHIYAPMGAITAPDDHGKPILAYPPCMVSTDTDKKMTCILWTNYDILSVDGSGDIIYPKNCEISDFMIERLEI